MGERGLVDPVTRVTLPAYYMDRTEVSVASYAACVQAGLCSEANVTTCGEQSNWGRPGRENHPINCIDWTQARTLCASRGARLPTEAEWEFAARGSDGRPYPWGSEATSDDRANFYSEAQGQLSVEGYRVRPMSLSDRASEDRGTSAVDSHAAGASPFGLLNMAGNVWEWVEDRYAPYLGGSVSNPQGPPAGTGHEERVVRGGGYSSMNAAGFRTFDRDSTLPNHRGRNLGFRCARNVGG